MYKIEKRFTLPIGHRLSKNKNRCFSIHGHGFIVLVGLKSEKLNDEDMVVDFNYVKQLVNAFLDEFDHCLLLNGSDIELANQLSKMGMRTMVFEHDPTAEKLAEILYETFKPTVPLSWPGVTVDYVTVYENENSKATYTE